jgi:hypothetical protein
MGEKRVGTPGNEEPRRKRPACRQACSQRRCDLDRVSDLDSISDLSRIPVFLHKSPD